MTRNRDDFSALQALRAGTIALVAIVALMVGLGATIAGQKEAAEQRASVSAANALQLQSTDTALAGTASDAARG